jgi:hypothetical protein
MASFNEDSDRLAELLADPDMQSTDENVLAQALIASSAQGHLSVTESYLAIVQK